MLQKSVEKVHSLVFEHGSIVSQEVLDFRLEFIDLLLWFPGALEIGKSSPFD